MKTSLIPSRDRSACAVARWAGAAAVAAGLGMLVSAGAPLRANDVGSFGEAFHGPGRSEWRPAEGDGPLGVPVGGVRALVLAQAASETTESDPVQETIERNVRTALRTTERAITRAAEAGRSMAYRLTSGGRPSVLVLSGAKLEGVAMETLSEGLAVMSRLLGKASAGGDSEEKVRFGGFLGLGGRDLDAMYLDGFGALFLLDVGFPLVPPAEASEEKSGNPVDAEWEEARREVREARGLGGIIGAWVPGHEEIQGGRYQEARVEKLKRSLIQALRHAANLEGVAGNETIAVTVFGPAALEAGGGVAESGGRRGGARSSQQTVVVRDSNLRVLTEDHRGGGVGATGSMLTLRVKKSEADALAKGQLGEEEFAKRVQVSAR